MLRNASHQPPKHCVKIFSSTAVGASNFAFCSTFCQFMHCTLIWGCFISVLPDVHNFYSFRDNNAFLWWPLIWDVRVEFWLPLLCFDTRSLNRQNISSSICENGFRIGPKVDWFVKVWSRTAVPLCTASCQNQRAAVRESDFTPFYFLYGPNVVSIRRTVDMNSCSVASARCSAQMKRHNCARSSREVRLLAAKQETISRQLSVRFGSKGSEPNHTDYYYPRQFRGTKLATSLKLTFRKCCGIRKEGGSLRFMQ